MKYFLLLSIIVCGLCSGCSFFNTSRQIIAVNVQPSDANVIINGLSYPGGSIYTEVPRAREVLIEVWKDKFFPEKYVIPFKLSSTGVLDACGTIFIIPVFGLFSSGAWELKENVVHIKLMPDPMAITTKAEAEVEVNEPEKTDIAVTEPAAMIMETAKAEETESEKVESANNEME